MTSDFSSISDPSSGLYFKLNGTVYLPNDTVVITDIGVAVSQTGIDIGEVTGNTSDARNSLVCVTTNVNTTCCRGQDGANVGEWYFPNGTIVLRNGRNYERDFTRIGYTQEVRLNRRNDATAPTGEYECRVPDEYGVLHTAGIIIVLFRKMTII